MRFFWTRVPFNYQYLTAFPLVTFTENENNTTCTFPNTEERFSIQTAAILLPDCKTQKASLENTITSTSAIKLRRSALLTTLTPKNITGNNGTHAGNISVFCFAAYKLFDLLVHDSILFCIPSTL